MIRKIDIPDDRYMCGLGEIGAKRVHAPWAPGRALFMASHFATEKGYLVDCIWAIYDFGSAVIVGAGRTKAAALQCARKSFQNRKALVREFIEGRAQLEARRARVQASIASFEEFKAKQSVVVVPAKRRRVFEQSKGECHYCNVKLEIMGDWQMDHYIARSKGGQDHLGNLVAACRTCNQKKGNLNGDEFKKHLSLINAA